jgi:hypothetical protein
LSEFLLESSHSKKGAQKSLNIAVAELADSVMQNELMQSERRKPKARHVTAAITRGLRAKLISWMMEAFNVLEFSPALLYGTVLTLDRYCAAVNETVENTTLGVALLAAICTEMKLSNKNDFHHGQWQRLLQHLCQGRFELPAILKMEHQVLSRLGFSVGVPTSYTFFTGLSLRIRSSETDKTEASRCLSLSLMLLHLALLDPDIQYRYSHAILAAGALSGGMGVTCGSRSEWREQLFADLASYSPPAGSSGETMEASVVACEEELLKLWAGCTSSKSEWSDFYGPFEMHFGGVARNRVARTFSPSARLEDIRSSRRQTIII